MEQTDPVRDQLIFDNMHRVHKAVGAFIRKHPAFRRLREDLTSEGTLRLIDSVDRFLEGDVDNLTAYLSLSIWSGLWQAAMYEDDIQTPRHCTARRVFTKAVDEFYDRQWDCDPSKLASERESLSAMASECCKDETDRMILSMLLSNRSIKEIARELDLGASTIRSRRKKMGKRLEGIIDTE